jgi:signal transduction histidine kinase
MSSDVGKATILIVDDTPENLHVLKGVLIDEYKVRPAISGKIALKLAIMDPQPELILLDIMMPDMDGYEVCRRLKAEPRTSGIPIIFVTALDQVRDEVKGFMLGAADFIMKPISPPIVKSRVKTHIALANQRHDLENQVQRRTKDLNEAMKQLEASNQALEIAIEETKETNLQLASANRAKADFLSVISHEMLTPLNHILGFSDILLYSTTLTPSNKQQVEIIKNSGNNLLLNIKDIIDFVQLDPVKFTLSRRKISIKKLVEEIVSGLSKEADKKGLTIQVKLEELTSHTVYGDYRRLSQILRHLLSNGIKFTDKGGVTLIVTYTEIPDQEQLCVNFIVQDSGCGIPKKMLSKIFDQFTQVESPNIRKNDGLGLGLTICNKLVRLMSGKLSIDRSDDSGTTVNFSVNLSTTGKR